MVKREFYESMKSKHPHLFESENQRLPVLVYGFETGPGWDPILEELFSKLSDSVRLFQVKEKFGGLRVYTEGATEEDGLHIKEAEKKASRTCDVCGEPGKTINDDGWLRTVCEYHEKHN